jgi:peptide deformylase
MILDILQWPDERLAEIAEEAIPGPETTQLLNDMAETIAAHKGVGLAAPQVGRSVRIICVMRFDDAGQAIGIMGLLNPRIIMRSGIRINEHEGCLSVDQGRTGVMVRRAVSIAIQAQNADGQTKTFRATGREARIIQHECDHLDGVVIAVRTPPRTKRPLASARATETS